MLKQAALRFLGGTERVVAVVMYFHIVVPENGGLGISNRYLQELNSSHRFGNNNVPVLPQAHEPSMVPPSDWIRLVDLFR
ncbi:hypothetical protein AW878_14360 [Bordetella pseudohinzii]|uniref:Uncharacterized protein n=2 Tax=Bordetella pseudohinzii TaxID=1331258 RepID=A0A0J6EUE0_9BORD|nr:hypothetical protein BBN53_20850 [Bordetella pseudohinzii]KMM24065.1 hypothetical protein L540_08000 [Bordetella pseudohinzii]KXA77874.1 hypothetical protein AW878_14360 [Bordetella pseudohinzii]KXA78069.1 hypothetical protein AW877_12815 [Bordetella pseudohinzii]CUJ13321.1 Uncharacterised protein [Bordetella pseudohinzii]